MIGISTEAGRGTRSGYSMRTSARNSGCHAGGEAKRCRIAATRSSVGPTAAPRTSAAANAGSCGTDSGSKIGVAAKGSTSLLGVIAAKKAALLGRGRLDQGNVKLFGLRPSHLVGGGIR